FHGPSIFPQTNVRPCYRASSGRIACVSPCAELCAETRAALRAELRPALLPELRASNAVSRRIRERFAAIASRAVERGSACCPIQSDLASTPLQQRRFCEKWNSLR